MVVVTARRSAFLQGDQAKLVALAQATNKPVFLWSYTVPSEKSVEVVSEAGYPLFRNLDSCTRAMRTLVDFRARRERLILPAKAAPAWAPDRKAAGSMLTSAGGVLAEFQARPVLAAHGIGSGEPGNLVPPPAAPAAAEKGRSATGGSRRERGSRKPEGACCVRLTGGPAFPSAGQPAPSKRCVKVVRPVGRSTLTDSELCYTKNLRGAGPGMGGRVSQTGGTSQLSGAGEAVYHLPLEPDH